METMYVCYGRVQVRSSLPFFVMETGTLKFNSTETVVSEEQMYSIRLGVFWEVTSYAPTGRYNFGGIH